jgi:hypothetical protein
MKMFIVFMFLVSTVSYADVFCRYDDRVINITKDEDGFNCIGELAMGGAVCFTGKRVAAIKLINSKKFREAFDGTDGEFVKGAHFSGSDKIAYTFVDQANEYEEKHVMNRCDRDFFGSEE